MKRGLIVDLDNTLYDWRRYFAPSFRAMVHAISRVTQVPEEQLIHEFHQVYKVHGTAEYEFAIQELDSIRALKLTEQASNAIVRIGRTAFRHARLKHLVLYPGVWETLTG